MLAVIFQLIPFQIFVFTVTNHVLFRFNGNLSKDDTVENITRLKFYLY